MKKGLLTIFVLIILLIGCSDDKKQDESAKENDPMVTGSWSGVIEVPNQPLNIQVSFEKEDKLTGTISIPVQGLENYPLSAIKVEEKSITFTMEIQNQYITFDGVLDGEEMSGTFKQNGQSFPFKLTNEGDIAKGEKEGTFLEVETEQGTLYGELEMPDGNGPFPVMIIIPGSGPTDRNGNIISGKNNSLKFLAEELADNGVASLRYDKRGAGKNVGVMAVEEDIDFNLFIRDATAWVDRLKKDDRFKEIGIIGHSQGSLVGMIAAAQKDDVNIFISLAGAGRSMDQVMYDQLKEQLPDELLKESKDILEQLKAGKTVDNVSQELQSLFRPSVQPFLSSWMKYDPAEEIKKLDIPTLIINGGNDIQVPVSEAEILHKAKADSEIVFIEKMNHVLKEAPEDREGNMATYIDPELPLADELMDGIMEFLKAKDFVQR